MVGIDSTRELVFSSTRDDVTPISFCFSERKQSRRSNADVWLVSQLAETVEKGRPIGQGTIQIEVASDVVSHLSFSIYKNFARAIRELISNAYDARATEVHIGLYLRSETPKVVIRDNGVGMNVVDMRKRLFRIGNATTLTEDIDPVSRRKRIGQFGVGFLSTFPYCTKLTVVSKKADEDSVVEVNVDTQRFFSGESFNVTEFSVPYTQYKSDLPINEGETIVTLEGIRPHIVRDLRQVRKRKSTSIDRFEGFQKFQWSICQFVPIQYPPDRKDLVEFFSYDGRNSLRLWLDGDELFRNVPKKAEVLESGERTFGNIRTKYVIMSPMEPVTPQEARGLQIRVRDVGIGLPSDFDVIKLKGRVLGKLNYICGEVHVTEGLVPVMVDRDSLSYTQSVAEMESFFRDQFTTINAKLERWAKDDRVIYAFIGDTPESTKSSKDLRAANLLHLPRSRVRAEKAEVPSTQKVRQVIQNYGYTVEVEPKAQRYSTLEVYPEKKLVRVFEAPTKAQIRITLMGKTYETDTEEWKHTRSIESACRIEGRKVIFNMGHPVFRVTKVDEATIKQLILGIALLVEGHPQKRMLFERFYLLLREVL
jgi:hypothetical protein